MRVLEELVVEVGALGEVVFSPGLYVYNGSAFGPGGLKRVDRHRELSVEGGSPHWHIDYLLVSDVVEVVDVFCAEGCDLECSLSRVMGGRFEGVPGFGCSDCGCGSHLFYGEGVEGFLEGFYRRV
ncbi:MAG: DUF123 domain-containing protein [Candidatus Nanohalobium sp.]